MLEQRSAGAGVTVLHARPPQRLGRERGRRLVLVTLRRLVPAGEREGEAQRAHSLARHVVREQIAQIDRRTGRAARSVLCAARGTSRGYGGRHGLSR
jgi:hypothetical protein